METIGESHTCPQSHLQALPGAEALVKGRVTHLLLSLLPATQGLVGPDAEGKGHLVQGQLEERASRSHASCQPQSQTPELVASRGERTVAGAGRSGQGRGV